MLGVGWCLSSNPLMQASPESPCPGGCWFRLAPVPTAHDTSSSSFWQFVSMPCRMMSCGGKADCPQLCPSPPCPRAGSQRPPTWAWAGRAPAVLNQPEALVCPSQHQIIPKSPSERGFSCESRLAVSPSSVTQLPSTHPRRGGKGTSLRC